MTELVIIGKKLKQLAGIDLVVIGRNCKNMGWQNWQESDLQNWQIGMNLQEFGRADIGRSWLEWAETGENW